MWYFAQGWTDGLPIVPPTEELVDRMIAASGRDAMDILGVVPPRQGVATIEAIATVAYPQELRIIALPRKPGPMPLFHTNVKGRCHGVAPVFLPARTDRTRVAVLPASSCLAE